MAHILLACALVLTMFLPRLAHAQQPVPGDACATPGLFMQSTGPELSGAGHWLVCQGGTWKAVMSFNNAAQVTGIGDQTCGTNEILKFDGTKWACASDAAASTTFSCPAGFTKITANSQILGCMQNAEKGSANWITASEDCFDTYGGRLPASVDWAVAMSNYTLTAETDDMEWLSDAATGSEHIVQGNPTIQDTDAQSNGNAHAYRCFIPVGANGIAGTEIDPKVGTLAEGKWCYINGGVIDCTQDAPSGGGITAVTTATCVASCSGAGCSDSCVTPNCPTTYFRTGCSSSKGNVDISGTLACTCLSTGSGSAGNNTCRVHCAK